MGSVFAQSTGLMNIGAVQDLSISTIYLMGFSFILGSMVTVLILLFLDMVRVMNENNNNQDS